MYTSNAHNLSISIGTVKSGRGDEIVLVYLDNGEAESLVVRYDRLSRPFRRLVKMLAYDPLGVLGHHRGAMLAA